MKKQNVRTISLIVCIFTFLLVGAAIFDSLESDYEAEDLRTLNTIKAHFINKYNITDDDFKNMTYLIKHLIPHNARQWKFAGAFYYSVTVMTTVGYGHSTPRTWGGKAFTMLYAFLGIPLGLVMFQSIGERLNVFATFILANIKRCFRFKSADVSQTNLIVIDFSLAMLVVFISAAVFDHYEGWGYWNAVYYCIITLTTIGFGDLVPLQTGESDLETRPEYVVFTLMFILFGLTVLSANMNLLVLRFMTINTEDERRDEMEAAVAALTAVKVEGDIIYGNDVKPFGLPSDFGGDYQKSPSRSWMGRNGGFPDQTPDNVSGLTKPSNTMDSINKIGDVNEGKRLLVKSASNSTLPVHSGERSSAVANGRVSSSSKLSPHPLRQDRAAKSKDKNNKEVKDSKKQKENNDGVTRRRPSMTAAIADQRISIPAPGDKPPDSAGTPTKPSKVTEEKNESARSMLPPPYPPSPSVAPKADISASTPSSPSKNVVAGKCTPSLGQCQVPNCRHQYYCRDGLSRNPADACPCPCHQDKAWWSYLLKSSPYSSNSNSGNQPPPLIKPPSSGEPQPPQRLYQQQGNTQTPKLPHYMGSNLLFGSKTEGGPLPLIPPPTRAVPFTSPALPPKSSPLLSDKSVNKRDSSQKPSLTTETDKEADNLLVMLASAVDNTNRKEAAVPHRNRSNKEAAGSLTIPLLTERQESEPAVLNKSLLSLSSNSKSRTPSVTSDTTVTTGAVAGTTTTGNKKSSPLKASSGRGTQETSTILTLPAVKL